MDLGINVFRTTEVQICVLVSKQLNLAVLQVLTVETGKTARQNQDKQPGRTRTNNQAETGKTARQKHDIQPGRTRTNTQVEPGQIPRQNQDKQPGRTRTNSQAGTVQGSKDCTYVGHGNTNILQLLWTEINCSCTSRSKVTHSRTV